MYMFNLERNTEGDWDLVFENGDLSIVSEAESVVVDIAERLLIDQTEAEDNPIISDGVGVQWYGIVFDSSKSRAEKELEIKRVILSTPGVQSITAWTWTEIDRVLHLDFRVKTIYGGISVSETITI